MPRTPKIPVLGEQQLRSVAVVKKVRRSASTGQFTGLPKNLQVAAARVTSSRAASIEFLKKGGFLTSEGKPSPAYISKIKAAPKKTAKKID